MCCNHHVRKLQFRDGDMWHELSRCTVKASPPGAKPVNSLTMLSGASLMALLRTPSRAASCTAQHKTEQRSSASRSRMAVLPAGPFWVLALNPPESHGIPAIKRIVLKVHAHARSTSTHIAQEGAALLLQQQLMTGGAHVVLVCFSNL